MKISSPIGELPFEITELTLARSGVAINGSMGAWPTSVDASWRDLLDTSSMAAKNFRLPALLAVGGVSVLVATLLTRKKTATK